MSSNHCVYYSWHPPLFHKSQKTSFQYPLFFASAESTFAFQLKTLRCFFLRPVQYPVPSPAAIFSTNLVTKSGSIISSITEAPIKTHSSLPSDILNPAPSLSHFENHQALYETFQANFSQKYSFKHYAQAQLYEYGIGAPQNLTKALNIYKTGCEELELGCLHQLIRLHVEPDLVDKFCTHTDFIEALSLFIRLFLGHGLFDYYSTREPSLKHYALFNLYMDIFPGFHSLVSQVCASSLEDNIWNSLTPNTDKEYKAVALALLQLLGQEDPYNSICIQTLRTLQSKADSGNPEACFLLADLYDTSLYGVSVPNFYERRLLLYSKAESSGNLVVTTRLFSLLKTLERFPNEISSPHWKNVEYYCNKLVNFQGIDFLRKEAQELIMGRSLHSKFDEVRRIHELLYYLDDHKTISNYFRILKFLKPPQADQLYQVAKTMRERKIGLYEIPWAYCFEKGKGVAQDLAKALQIYQEAFEKLLLVKNESKSFLYYRIGVTMFQAEVIDTANFFFDLAVNDLFSHFNHDPANISILYELSKLLLKGRGLAKNSDLAFEILEHLVPLKPSSMMDNFTLLYAKRKLGRLRNKFGESNISIENPWFEKPSGTTPKNRPGILDKIARIEKERQKSYVTQDSTEMSGLKEVIEKKIQSALEIARKNSDKKFDSIVIHDIDNDVPKQFLLYATSTESLRINTKEQNTKKNPQETGKMDSPNKGGNAPPILQAQSISNIHDIKQSSIRGDLNVYERVQALLEHHKKKSYNMIAQQLQIPEKVKTLLAFLKSALKDYLTEYIGEIYRIDLKSNAIQKMTRIIQDILQQLAAENSIIVLNMEKFQLDKNNDKTRTLAIHVENGQVFELKSQTFPIIHVAELVSETPTIFYLPLNFLHPQFFPIYGLSFTWEDAKLTINYFLEPKKASLPSYLASNAEKLKLNARVSLALDALYAIHAFHVIDIPLLTLSSHNFSITADGELRLFDLFLALYEPSDDISYRHQHKAYQGLLEALSPDIFRTNGRMSIASDIYCFGLLFYEILTGEKLYSFNDFDNETDLCEKIKNGYLKHKLAEQRNNKTTKFPSEFEDLLLSCLSFHKKKRPTTEQLILALQSLQQNNTKEVLELPFSLQTVMEKQYRSLHFSTSIDQDNCFFLLPGSIIYKGQTKRKIPDGEGELVAFGRIGYKGTFQRGVLNGKGTVHLVKRNEYLTGTFKEGYPIQGIFSTSEKQEGGTKLIFEKQSWIPNEEYRAKIIKGFEPLSNTFLDYVKFRREKLYDDNVNFDMINKYVQFMISEEVSRQKKANVVDCFGNFFYLKTQSLTSNNKDPSYIVKGGFLTENLLRLYDTYIKESILFQADLAGIDLYYLKGKTMEPIKYPILTSFEEMVRYFHFGYRYLGRMENGHLRKGVIHINYTNYFWYEAPSKLYQGANFIKRSNCLYVGNILKNKADGFGVEYISKSKRYEGEYIQGSPHGRGVIFNDAGKVEFVGILCNGKPHYGLYYEGERVYEGKFTIIKANSRDVEDSKRETSRDENERPAASPWTVDSDLNFNSNFLFIIPTEIHKQKPYLKVISSIISEDYTRSEEDNEDKPVRTEFEGSVRNFSDNVKEIQGKFIMEDKKFNGNYKVFYADGSLYDGHLRNGARCGFGTFKMNNGSLFTGLWDHGRLKGKIIWGSSSKVLEYSEGEFIRERNGNTRHNNFGRLKFKNGDFYEGEILNGLMEGFGTFFFKSGEIYEGMMKNNKPEGIGRLWFNRDAKRDYYEGQFRDGKKEGYGVLYSNGDIVFKGRFQEDKAVVGRLAINLEGLKGHEAIANKSKSKLEEMGWYVGNVAEDKDQRLVFDNWGLCFFNTKIIEGEYENGELKNRIARIVDYNPDKGGDTTYFGEIFKSIPHGLGQMTFSSNNTENDIEVYEGEWEFGVRRGMGKFVYKGGDQGKLYKGTVINDREGIGEWTIEDATVYRGEFAKNLREGRGILIKQGRPIIGKYQNGKVLQLYYGRKDPNNY